MEIDNKDTKQTEDFDGDETSEDCFDSLLDCFDLLLAWMI